MPPAHATSGSGVACGDALLTSPMIAESLARSRRPKAPNASGLCTSWLCEPNSCEYVSSVGATAMATPPSTRQVSAATKPTSERVSHRLCDSPAAPSQHPPQEPPCEGTAGASSGASRSMGCKEGFSAPPARASRAHSSAAARRLTRLTSDGDGVSGVANTASARGLGRAHQSKRSMRNAPSSRCAGATRQARAALTAPRACAIHAWLPRDRSQSSRKPACAQRVLTSTASSAAKTEALEVGLGDDP